MPLPADTALGMRPDMSKLRLPINFAFLVAKYHIWTCKQKEICSLNFSSFLRLLKNIHEIEKGNKSTSKKCELLLPHI